MTRRVYVWQRSDALDEATAARRAQPRAQCLGRFASIRRDPDAMPDRRVAHGRAHDERLTAAEDRLIFLLQLRVSGERVALQTIAAELHRPGGAWRRRRARGHGSPRIGSQAAFVPNQTGEELDRQLVLRRHRLDQWAKRLR